MNRFGRQITFLIIFLCFVCHLLAQVPSLYFDKLTNQNGLSNNKVNCILQDKRGFIWFGTDDGLNRYDGNNFTIFRNQPGNPYCVSGNMIMDLVEDQDGVLWIATADGGLTKYNYRLSPREQFIQYKHLPADTNSIPVNMLNALLQDQQGNIWIATSGAGVLRFNRERETFTRGSLARGSTCLDLEFDENGIIWVGKHGGGIMKINPREGMPLKWDQIKRAVIGKDYFVLFINKAQLIHLPFRIFNSENERKFLSSILRNKGLVKSA